MTTEGAPATATTAAAPRARRPTGRPAAWPVIAGSAAAFFAALAFLAAQVREGRDPALGPAKAATPATPRPVVVRRVIERVVVHHPPPAVPSAAGAGAGTGGMSASAPTTSAAPSAPPAPAAAAPPPAVAARPAPAPAPAPLTTQSS